MTMIHKSEFMEILKVINGMSYDEVRGHLDVDSWACPEEFDDLFNGMRKDLFHGLCNLDEGNQALLIDRAFDKMILARHRVLRKAAPRYFEQPDDKEIPNDQ